MNNLDNQKAVPNIDKRVGSSKFVYLSGTNSAEGSNIIKRIIKTSENQLIGRSW